MSAGRELLREGRDPDLDTSQPDRPPSRRRERGRGVKILGFGGIRSRLVGAFQPSPMVLKPYANRMPVRGR